MEELKSKRKGRIINLRNSLALILTEELDDFERYEQVTISKLKNGEIIIKQEEEK